MYTHKYIIYIYIYIYIYTYIYIYIYNIYIHIYIYIYIYIQYIDRLDDIVNEYNNTYHRTIKRKAIVVKTITYIDFGV